MREGYQAVRRTGRYAVFAGAALDVVSGRLGRLDGLFEIWNGMPFLSPLWFRGPRIVFLHHVHAGMWQVLSPTWRGQGAPSRRGSPPTSTGGAGSSPCPARPGTR